ncbi:MAG: glutaminyl-peptide cyclotransferase [Gammaproteobacteria bacterium]
MPTSWAMGGTGVTSGCEVAVDEAPVTFPRVAEVVPHDPAAFTQGLVFAGGQLFESTGRYGVSDLRRIDPRTGRVLARRALNEKLFGEGLAVLGDGLWQLTWRENTVLVWDRYSLEPVGEHHYNGQGWGLTTHDGHFYMSDGSARLSVRDPRRFSVRGYVQVCDHRGPVQRLNELEWVNGMIWANVWHSSRIAVIDPTDGRVRHWLDLARIVAREAPDGGVLNGIARNPTTGDVWITGKLWSHMYRITGYPGEAKP